MGCFQLLTKILLTCIISPRATEQMHPQNLILFVDIVTQQTDAEGLHKLRKVLLWQRECSVRPKVNFHKAEWNAVAM